MLRTPAVVAACAAVLLVASACTDDKPEPNYSSVSTSPTPSASPTPSVSAGNTRPGETAPVQPVEATANDIEGAQAFATYYVKTIDWVFATGDVDILRPFYAAECTTCAGRLAYLSDLFANGQTLQGGRVSIVASQVVDNDGRLGAAFAISTAVSVEASTVLDGAGATASALPSTASATVTTWLSWAANGWVIVEERSA